MPRIDDDWIMLRKRELAELSSGRHADGLSWCSSWLEETLHRTRGRETEQRITKLQATHRHWIRRRAQFIITIINGIKSVFTKIWLINQMLVKVCLYWTN